MQKNYIFTWACGANFQNSIGFRVFLESIHRYTLNLAVFSDEFHGVWNKTLCNLGHDTVLVENIYYLLRDRWFYYAKSLYNMPDTTKYVLLCDSKDVVFQDDPFKIVDDLNLKGEFTILCEEGIMHGENDWNGGDQFRCQIHVVGEWKKEFLDRPVLNGGFMLGTPKKLAQLATMIWTNMIRNPQPPFSDQAMLNFLYFWIEQDPEIITCNPLDHNLCLTGQGVIEKKVLFNIKNNSFINLKTDEKYYAFHQWDRTIWADSIKNSYGIKEGSENLLFELWSTKENKEIDK